MLDLSKIQFATQKDDKEPGVTHFCGMITIGAAGKSDDKNSPPMESIRQHLKETIWNDVYGDLREPMIELVKAIDNHEQDEPADQVKRCKIAADKLTSLLVIKKPVINGMQ